MAIKGILLDMDGTLLDSEKYYTEGTFEWMKREGFTGSLADIYPIVGTTMEETYQYLQKLLPCFSQEELQQKNESFFLVEKPLSFRDLLFPDVKENIQKLRRKGYRLALCSLSGRREVNAFLKENELFPYFELSLAREDCQQAKPHPEIWLKALQKMNLHPEEVLIVEDSYNGILSAKRAGVYTWARKDERFGSNQKNADAYFTDLAQVVSYIEEKENE